jgi:hypothetical protein
MSLQARFEPISVQERDRPRSPEQVAIRGSEGVGEAVGHLAPDRFLPALHGGDLLLRDPGLVGELPLRVAERFAEKLQAFRRGGLVADFLRQVGGVSFYNLVIMARI